MKKKLLKPPSIGVLFLASVTLFSCKDNMVPDENSENVNEKKATVMNVASTDLPGRTLAANCFQCHGTNGNAGELKIAGESASEIISELNEMKGKDPRRNIMNVHAQAYTADEIKLIADYISKQ